MAKNSISTSHLCSLARNLIPVTSSIVRNDIPVVPFGDIFSSLAALSVLFPAICFAPNCPLLGAIPPSISSARPAKSRVSLSSIIGLFNSPPSLRDSGIPRFRYSAFSQKSSFSNTFLPKNLHISEKSTTFAPSFAYADRR